MRQIFLILGAFLGVVLGLFIIPSGDDVRIFMAFGAGCVGLVIAYALNTFFAVRELKLLGYDIPDELYASIRQSDATKVVECLLAGAKASDLRESTVRHAVRRIRIILRLCRFLGY